MVIYLTRGDYGFNLNFEVLQADGKTPVDLTNASVKFKMKHQATSKIIIDASCEIMDGANGRCRYTVRDGDLSMTGSHRAELELTFGSEKVLTANLERIEVQSDI